MSMLKKIIIQISRGTAMANAITTILEAAMQSGHTSGMDAVTDLLFGIASWERETILAFN